MDFYLHVGEEHLEDKELEKIRDYYNYIILKRSNSIKYNSSKINSDDNPEKTQSIILRLLMQVDDPEILSEFCSRVENKTIIKYKTLFQKCASEFLKSLLLKYI